MVEPRGPGGRFTELEMTLEGPAAIGVRGWTYASLTALRLVALQAHGVEQVLAGGGTLGSRGSRGWNVRMRGYRGRWRLRRLLGSSTCAV